MSVLFWNDVALEANRRDHSGPGAPSQGGPHRSSRALAIVHAAMADAYCCALRAESGGAPFDAAFVSALPPGDADPGAALAGAAHRTLTVLFPDQRAFLDDRLAAFLGDRGPSASVRAGLGFGRAIGQSLLDLRDDDGAAMFDEDDDQLYEPGGLPGLHDEDPLDPGQGFQGRRWGLVRPFLLRRAEVIGVLPPAPPTIADPRYRRDRDEVRDKGGRRGGIRTEEETEIGLFWAYDGATCVGSPPRLYNQAVRAVGEAEGRPLSEAEWVRLLALANLAMADAGIVAWQAKYVHNVWRPVLGVREDPALDGDDASQADAEWTPLGAPRSDGAACRGGFTPPSPSYPSEHAAFGAACLGAVLLFRAARGETHPDAVEVDLVSDELDDRTRDGVRPRRPRRFRSLEAMIRESGESRIFLGVHWRFDGVAGTATGRAVASRVSARAYAAVSMPANVA